MLVGARAERSGVTEWGMEDHRWYLSCPQVKDDEHGEDPRASGHIGQSEKCCSGAVARVGTRPEALIEATVGLLRMQLGGHWFWEMKGG